MSGTAPQVASGGGLRGAQRSIRLHLIIGLAVVGLVAGGFGGWSATTKISGALIAPGQIVVESNVKKVQNPTGGVIGQLLAHDGDQVKAGQILVRLDDTITKANLTIVTRGLDAALARAARLQAEQGGLDKIDFPSELTSRAGDPDVSNIMLSETKLFQVRVNGRAGQKAQLRERIRQLKEEVRGLDAQEKAKEQEIALVQQELTGVRELYQKHLVQLSRLTTLERDAAQLDGERAQYVASMAQTRAKISETKLQIIQIDKDMISEVSKALRETNDKIGELKERKVTAEDQLRRVEIRAPQDGVVEQSKVHTVGGVISPGETIMLIVPQKDKLQVSAKVDPKDIEQLRVGQKTMLQLSSFDPHNTPELKGIVVRISPDVATDARTGHTYYTIRISLPPKQVARLGEVRLLPGMPVEAFVQTGERTVLSYLMKPLSEQFKHAFKEK
jgi:membrane fusion protein, type I secretion system